MNPGLSAETGSLSPETFASKSARIGCLAGGTALGGERPQRRRVGPLHRRTPEGPPAAAEAVRDIVLRPRARRSPRAQRRRPRAAALNRSPTIFGESGTTRSSGAGLAAARSVRTAPATAPFTNRTSLVSPSWFVFPRRTVTSTLVAVGRVVDVGPAKRAHLAPAHPPHEKEPGDHGVEAAAIEGDLLGLAAAAAPARLMAGGEDGGKVRRPERPRLPESSTACRPPVAGADPGRPFPGSGRRRGGPGSTPRPPPSPRSPAPGPGRGARRGTRPGWRPRATGRRARRRGGGAPRSRPGGCSG